MYAILEAKVLTDAGKFTVSSATVDAVRVLLGSTSMCCFYYFNMSNKNPDTLENKETKTNEDEGHSPISSLSSPVVSTPVVAAASPPQSDECNHACATNDEDSPSMTWSLFVYWVIPLLLIATLSRRLTDTSIPTIAVPDDLAKRQQQAASQRKSKRFHQPPADKTASTTLSSSSNDNKYMPPLPSSWPNAYKEILATIYHRRRYIEPDFEGDIHQEMGRFVSGRSNASSSFAFSRREKSKSTRQSSSSPFSSSSSKDPMRRQFHERIRTLRQEYERSSTQQEEDRDLFLGIRLADAMRLFDMQFHEGGTYEREAMELYDSLIVMATRQRDRAMTTGEASRERRSSVHDEVTLDYSERSWDGILCGLHTSQGKLYFMANMFERAVQSYDQCLQLIAPADDIYLDAQNSRGSALIVLGRYEEAGRDFLNVIRKDEQRMLVDAFTGLARILEAKEDSVLGGWDSILDLIQNDLIPRFEQLLQSQPQAKQAVTSSLSRLYHVLFTYHESKTKNYPEAFRLLTKSHEYKLSILPPWNVGFEKRKIAQNQKIFTHGFWPPGTGSSTRAPIFIIGFVRSGSTLLERILDAHPLIAGTGENSVFNGRLDDIRNQIVQASTVGYSLGELTERLADEVVEEMLRRWEMVQSNFADHEKSSSSSLKQPERLVDKMLTNYYNIGFIQLLYPNALILHVAREPMDTIFSAFKHEFPPGTLDYTSDYAGLSELYHCYRDMIYHWDKVLPGRITHIRYEDLVKDFEGVAHAVINATGLPWDDSVLQFHKKKHAVNTLSSTQVRKGIYTSSLKSWMRYENELQPLIEMIGDRFTYEFKTSLPGYQPKVVNEEL